MAPKIAVATGGLVTVCVEQAQLETQSRYRIDMRIGYGIRHPELLNILASVTPIAEEEGAWANGTVPLRLSVYDKPTQLPDELITSVRCLVVVRDQILVCHNADGFTHAWPGGRRNPGETYTQTAVREVHEETGWHVEPDTVREIGWMHIQHLTPRPADHPYPHPDFLQVICRGEATTRAGDPDTPWTDLEGYELRSTLHSPSEARALMVGDKLCQPFIELAMTAVQ